jgi:SAM-dependent methyltransferase
MPRATYIHGTGASEQQRLVELNRLTNDAFVRFLDVQPAMSVLEVGSGLGILAERVAAIAQRVVGLEISWAQISMADDSSGVVFVQGDAQAIPFENATFDLVYSRYLLEHVSDPPAVLAEIHRVLRPGGCVAVLENDVSLIRFDPPCPLFDQVWAAFVDLQRRLGGDALIGRRLFRLFHAAGFRDVELSVQPEVHWFGSPSWRGWVMNIIGNVESARTALIERDLSSRTAVDAAIDELGRLVDRPEGSALFVWNRARGVRGPLPMGE